jgi:protein-L-isoaspartate(D-aspartate) O-methyltransferase
MQDFAARRMTMVDTQVRPSDVTKFPIIDAMLRTPRELFVPETLVEAAYMGENVHIADGRVLLDPRTLAKMLDALEVTHSDLVLDIAAGTGYSSAILAQMAQGVVAVEQDAGLAQDAGHALAHVGAEAVVVHVGPLTDGAPVHAPFDAIILQGGIELFPDTLTAQLQDGGRVVALFMSGQLGVVRLGTKNAGVIGWRDIFNATAPILPGFALIPSFAL